MTAGDERYWDAEVTSVAVTDHWRLQLEFADGYSGEADVSYLRRKPGLLKDLKDPDYFARAYLDEEQGTVAWPNGMDVAAHLLRARAEQQASRWRSRRGHTDLTWSLTLGSADGEPRRTRVFLRLRMAPVRHKLLARTAGELVTVAGMAAGLRERLAEPDPGV